MNTIGLAIEKEAVDKEMSIWRTLDVAVFIEVDAKTIGCWLLGKNYHIWKDVHVIGTIDIDCLEFFHEITGFSFDYIAETIV